MNVHVRGVAEDLWQEMRIRAIKEKRPVGELVNEAFWAFLFPDQPYQGMQTVELVSENPDGD